MSKWIFKSFKISEQLQLKTIGKHGLKRTQYLVYRKEDHAKKYIHDFLANLEESFLS